MLSKKVTVGIALAATAQDSKFNCNFKRLAAKQASCVEASTASWRASAFHRRTARVRRAVCLCLCLNCGPPGKGGPTPTDATSNPKSRTNAPSRPLFPLSRLQTLDGISARTSNRGEHGESKPKIRMGPLDRQIYRNMRRIPLLPRKNTSVIVFRLRNTRTLDRRSYHPTTTPGASRNPGRFPVEVARGSSRRSQGARVLLARPLHLLNHHGARTCFGLVLSVA